MTKKIFHYLLEGKLLGVLYEKVFLFLIPEIRGRLSLLFYRMIYSPRLKILGVKCWGSVVISKSPDSLISIGDQVRIVSDFARAGIALRGNGKCKISAYAGSQISIGDRVALSGTSITCRTTSIAIGEGTIIAPNVIIVDSGFHAPQAENGMSHLGHEKNRHVKIGKNVWIGLNSVINGVEIGENSIVAAGSVVIDDAPANVLIGGNPARILKHLTQ